MFLISGRPAWLEVELKNRPLIPHTFVIHSYTKPTKEIFKSCYLYKEENIYYVFYAIIFSFLFQISVPLFEPYVYSKDLFSFLKAQN